MSLIEERTWVCEGCGQRVPARNLVPPARWGALSGGCKQGWDLCDECLMAARSFLANRRLRRSFIPAFALEQLHDLAQGAD